MWSVNLNKTPSLCRGTAALHPGHYYMRETFVSFFFWGGGCCLFYHVNIKWQTVSETVSSSGEGSNLSARQHPPKYSLGTDHKASLWVLPAGIHLKTAEHNFGIKVELDLKAKQRKCPKPIIILTSKEVTENVGRNPCKGRAN